MRRSWPKPSPMSSMLAGARQFAPCSRRPRRFRSSELQMTWLERDWLIHWLGQTATRLASVSSRPSLTANDRKSSSKQCQGFAVWRHLPTLRTQWLRSLTNCGGRHEPGTSSFQFTGSPRARRLQRPSTRRKHPAPQRSTFLASPMLDVNHRLIMDRAAVLRLPAMFQWPEVGEEGGFSAYGPRFIDILRDLQARQLIQLLHGVKLADIPVEQPTKFELMINLKTANKLGVTVPAILVARADKVI